MPNSRDKRPVAPPVYRPQPTPLVLQRKTLPHQTVLQSKPKPVAPPAYRPQPVPKVLQTKIAPGKQTNKQAETRKIGPPVPHASHRANSSRIVQPKRVMGLIQMAEDQHLRLSSPTIYSHTHTRPTSQISSKPQGPHTVAHTLVSHGFHTATEDDDWENLEGIWGLHIPSLAEIKAIVAVEKPGKIAPTMQQQFDRYYDDYERIYDQAEQAINTRADFATASRLVREIMELHPYQTYAWKTGRAAAKSSTAGKGEGFYFKQWKSTGQLTDLLKLLDVCRCRFKDKDGFRNFVQYRLELAGIEPEAIQSILGQI